MSTHTSLLKGVPVTIRETAEHLAVIESKVTKDGIDRELRQIDAALFIDAEFDAEFGRLCYAVKVHVGSNMPPHLVCDWREPTTRRPLDLSSGLIGKVARMASERGMDNVKLAAEQNEAMRLYNERESDRHYEEITVDMVPRMKGLKNTIQHRPTTAEGIASARRRARRHDVERKMGLR